MLIVFVFVFLLPLPIFFFIVWRQLVGVGAASDEGGPSFSPLRGWSDQIMRVIFNACAWGSVEREG